MVLKSSWGGSPRVVVSNMGMVALIMVVVLLMVSTMSSDARKACTGTYNGEDSWDGTCYNLGKPASISYHTRRKEDNHMGFCTDFVSSEASEDTDTCLCNKHEYTLKDLDRKADDLYHTVRDFVINTGHYIDTNPLSNSPACESAIKSYACDVMFPSCNGTECQYCTYLNNWLEICLGIGAANARLCDQNTWALDSVPRKNRTCDCCQNNPVVDSTDYFDDEGLIHRIDQHTGVNLWISNHIIAITSCCLSVCGSTLIIISFFVFRSRLLKTFQLRLILYLSMNDLVQAFLHGSDHAFNVSHGYVVPGNLCQSAGWWIGTFVVGNICWMICIVYYLHKIVVRQNSSVLPDWVVIGICVLLPNYHIFPLIQFPHLSYGPRGNWCYIQDSQPTWQIVFLAVPTYLGWTITAVLYTHIVFVIIRSTRTVNKLDGDSSAAKKRAETRNRLVRRLLGYPVIFTIQFLPLVIEFILVWTKSSTYSITITDLFTVWCINLSGFMNFLWFSYNERLFSRYKYLIQHGKHEVTEYADDSSRSRYSATRPVSNTNNTNTNNTNNTTRSSSNSMS